ncbi:hypothetical protein M5K25_023877 [Dendrobium thyrsiflorum]|uniref:Uncharacterized protein n=1 Tax=Dendrobium thyrsiflorum TaxID=117978 RepID=A0ABD0U0U3_DENTH
MWKGNRGEKKQKEDQEEEIGVTEKTTRKLRRKLEEKVGIIESGDFSKEKLKAQKDLRKISHRKINYFTVLIWVILVLCIYKAWCYHNKLK